jgi:hypothetical protein
MQGKYAKSVRPDPPLCHTFGFFLPASVMHLYEGEPWFVRDKRQEGTGVALPGTTGKPGAVPGEITAISWRRNSRETPPGLIPSSSRDNAGVRIRSTPTYIHYTTAALCRQ